MSEKLRKQTDFKYGFKADLKTKWIRFFASCLVRLLGLNNNSKFSTEVCQMLNPKIKIMYQGQPIQFMSGHGRLKWRAESFYTEEPLMIDWLNSFSKEDVFLDIGANVGTYSIPAATKVKRVISIELDPNNVFCLNTNIYLNGLQDKVLIIPFAASDRKSVQDIYYREFSIGDALQSVGRDQVLPTIKNHPYKLQQLTMPVDVLFREYELEQPTKIKIDVDGNEKIVLDGAWETIEKADEVYFEDNGLDVDIELLEKFFQRGFVVLKEMPSNVGSVKSDIARNIVLKKIR